MKARTESSRNSTESTEWVAVGVVVGAFGVRGELKVEPLTDVPGRFEQLATVYLGEDHNPGRVQRVRDHKGLVLIELEGISDMTAAERLRGTRLWIPAAEIAPLAVDQYYIHDLIGLSVHHVNGEFLGSVVDVIAGTGNDLLVVRNGAAGEETLVPAAKAFVRSVDLAAGTLTIDPIPGLFDDQAEIAHDTAEDDGPDSEENRS